MPVRLSRVPRQKVWGDAPLLLPLIKMSDAEHTVITGPQIYDNPYPLDYDGLMLDPSWSASPYYSGPVHGGNIDLSPAEKNAGMGYLGASAAQQAAAQRKAAAQAQQAAIQQQKAAAAQAAAKSKADAQAAIVQAKQAAAEKKKADADKAAADRKVEQLRQACTRADGVFDPGSQQCSGYATAAAYLAAKKSADKTAAVKAKADAKSAVAADKANTALANFKAACAAANGVWSDDNKCSGFTDIRSYKASLVTQKKQETKDAAIAKRDERKDALAAKKDERQTALEQKKADAKDAADAKKQVRLDTAALRKNEQECRRSKGMWDAVNGVCQQLSAPDTPYPPSIYGPYPGTDPLVGTPPPTYPDPTVTGGPFPTNPYPTIDPSTNYPPPPPTYPPQYPMQPPTYPPAPSPDMFGGGGGGGGAPMSMTPPTGSPSGQFNEQANSFATTDQSGDEEAATIEDAEGQTSDDASAAANTNIVESVKKLFGFNGINCGLDAPPSWFSTGMGGNVPYRPSITKKAVKPVNQSTTSGVLLAAGVLVVGSAALYMWSKKKGKKK